MLSYFWFFTLSPAVLLIQCDRLLFTESIGSCSRWWHCSILKRPRPRAHRTNITHRRRTVNATGYSNAPMSLPLLLFFFYHGPTHRHVLWNVNKTQTSPRHNSLCGCCCLLWCVCCAYVNWFFSFYWPVKLFGFGFYF